MCVPLSGRGLQVRRTCNGFYETGTFIFFPSLCRLKGPALALHVINYKRPTLALRNSDILFCLYLSLFYSYIFLSVFFPSLCFFFSPLFLSLLYYYYYLFIFFSLSLSLSLSLSSLFLLRTSLAPARLSNCCY